MKFYGNFFTIFWVILSASKIHGVPARSPSFISLNSKISSNLHEVCNTIWVIWPSYWYMAEMSQYYRLVDWSGQFSIFLKKSFWLADSDVKISFHPKCSPFWKKPFQVRAWAWVEKYFLAFLQNDGNSCLRQNSSGSHKSKVKISNILCCDT